MTRGSITRRVDPPLKLVYISLPTTPTELALSAVSHVVFPPAPTEVAVAAALLLFCSVVSGVSSSDPPE